MIGWISGFRMKRVLDNKTQSLVSGQEQGLVLEWCGSDNLCRLICSALPVLPQANRLLL